MSNLPCHLTGSLNCPVQNQTKAYTLGCDIRYDLLALCEISNPDEADADKAKAYLTENIPLLLKEALIETNGSPLPLMAFSHSQIPIEEALLTMTEKPLAAFGVKPVSFRIIALSLSEQSRKFLSSKENPDKWAGIMEEVQNNMCIDECMKPENMPPDFGPVFVTPIMPGTFPKAADAAPWNCPMCGKAGNTAKFCPECGTVCPELK